MWIVNFLPDFIFHALLLVSILALVASFVLDSIPFVSTNAKAIQLASAVVLAIVLYFEGAISDNNSWLARVAALEKQVAVAEAKSKETNTVIQYQYRDKVRTIKETQVVVQERIVKEAAKMDAECKISPEAVSILNQAAGGKK
jgi:methionine-rich copper-binding protein CopC